MRKDVREFLLVRGGCTHEWISADFLDPDREVASGVGELD
ncbi:hypothetical protein ABIG04_009389 [Bradyrhizobium japonicum]